MNPLLAATAPFRTVVSTFLTPLYHRLFVPLHTDTKKGGNHGTVQHTRIRPHAVGADVLPRHHARVGVEETQEMDGAQPGAHAEAQCHWLRPPQPLVHASAGAHHHRSAGRAIAVNIFSGKEKGDFHIGNRQLSAWLLRTIGTNISYRQYLQVRQLCILFARCTYVANPYALYLQSHSLPS